MTIQQDRLTSEQFKAILIGKGWTYRALAAHWGITPVWLSNISRNSERPKHYDDAVMGLPGFANLNRSKQRRQQQANVYIQKTNGKRQPTGVYRHHGRVVTGSILAVFEDFGTCAQTGMRGIVFQVKATKIGEEYGVIFETGKWEWLDATLIDQFLVDTGLLAQEIIQYRFESETRLKEDFEAGVFLFREK